MAGKVKLSRSEWREVQRHLNAFTDKYLAGVGPLFVDGKPGPSTERRIRLVRWWLGYERRALDSIPTLAFRRRLTAPRSRRWASRAAIERGEHRRREQRESWRRNLEAAHRRSGVETFDGIPVAKWMVPYCEFARQSGEWDGVVLSGWRDPHHSQDLCFAICGAPSCPGRCAGLASNHVGDDPPPTAKGALDVTDRDGFDRAMRKCPLEPRLFNALGPADPNHFSATGR